MTLPANLQAEEALIGAMLLSSDAINDAVANVSADEFMGERTRMLFDAIVALWLAGEVVDAVTVCERLGRAKVEIRPDEVHALSNKTPNLRGGAQYAQIIANHAAMRRLMFIGDELRTKAAALPDDPYELARDAAGWLEDIVAPIAPMEPGPDLDSFLAQSDAAADMIVPGFLERTDRMVLTGGEGQGKSTFARQAGVQMAASIVPFTHAKPCAPCRVLLVDCENPAGKLRRQLAPLRAQAGDRLDPARFVVVSHDRGLDLLGRHDRRWFESLIVANRPDVVITGPIYKLHSGDPTEERPAANLRDFFDDLRTRYRFALMLEAHQPYAMGGGKRPLRPYGASLWSRWPDIGLCLVEPQPDDDKKRKPEQGAEPKQKPWHLAEFRAFREDRPAWPVWLTRHERQPWPWMNAGRASDPDERLDL